MHLAAHSWPFVVWMGFWAFVLYGSLPSWAGPCLIMSFSLFSPFFTLFVGLLALLPCHSIIPVVVLLDSCLLGFFWAYCMLFFYLILVAQYYHWASIHAISGFLDPFYCLRASSFLGILGPFPFLKHPWPILILHSHGPLLSLLGFLGPITISFTFGVHGLPINFLLN